MSWTKFWKETDAQEERAKQLLATVKAEIEENSPTLGGKWKFVGVSDGTKWTARHRMHGEITELSHEALIKRVKAINKVEAT